MTLPLLEFRVSPPYQPAHILFQNTCRNVIWYSAVCECVRTKCRSFKKYYFASKIRVWQISCVGNSSGGDDDDVGARDCPRQDKPLKYLRDCRWRSESKLGVKQLNTKQTKWLAMFCILRMDKHTVAFAFVRISHGVKHRCWNSYGLATSRSFVHDVWIMETNMYSCWAFGGCLLQEQNNGFRHRSKKRTQASRV